MALSNHDQHILDELEQQMQTEDPKLAAIFDHQPLRKALTLLACGAAVLASGLVLLFIGLRLQSVPLGVGAFTAMCAGAYLATQPAALAGWRRLRLGNLRKQHSVQEP